MNTFSSGEPISDNVLERLDEATEHGVNVLRLGIVGLTAIFFPGSAEANVASFAIVDALGNYMSNQKFNRTKQTLGYLNEKVSQEQLEDRLETDEDYHDLFTSGIRIASESKEKERIQIIANILATGINPNANTAILKRYLSIIRRLDELDLMLLIAMKKRYESFIVKRKDSAIPTYITDASYTEAECTELAAVWSGISKPKIDSKRRVEYISINDFNAENSIKRMKNDHLINAYREDSQHQQPFYHISQFGRILMDYLESDKESGEQMETSK